MPMIATLAREHPAAPASELLARNPGLDAEAATPLLVDRLLREPCEALRDHDGTDAQS
jgi:hypothetical protein